MRHDLGLGGPRLGKGALGGHRDEGMQGPVEPFDPRQMRLRQLDRRELAGGDQRRRLGNRQRLAHRRVRCGTKIVAGSASAGRGERPRTRSAIASMWWKTP
jgi:hypothetical protein